MERTRAISRGNRSGWWWVTNGVDLGDFRLIDRSCQYQRGPRGEVLDGNFPVLDNTTSHRDCRAWHEAGMGPSISQESEVLTSCFGRVAAYDAWKADVSAHAERHTSPRSRTAPQGFGGEPPLQGRLFSAVLNGLDNLIDRGRLDEHIVEASVCRFGMRLGVVRPSGVGN